MNFSLATVGGVPTEADRRRYQTLGAVCQLLAQVGAHQGVSLHLMVDRLRMPIELSQIRVYFNHFGQCMGYVTWAYLCPDVEQRLLASAAYAPLNDFEWNEGNNLWIIDMLAVNGSVREVLADMRDELFKASHSVTYFRFKRGKRFCKRVSRTDCSSFCAVRRGMGDQHQFPRVTAKSPE